MYFPLKSSGCRLLRGSSYYSLPSSLGNTPVSTYPLWQQARSPLSRSSYQERSLPDLTEIIEFLEQIQCLHPSIQRIAIRLYSWAKGIDQRHLYRIASICSKRGAV